MFTNVIITYNVPTTLELVFVTTFEVLKEE
jgi:hypothetical protein